MTAVTRQATSDLSNTGGYTTAPLFSKINDGSDSTMIVGVTAGGGRATFGFTAFTLTSADIVDSVVIHYRHRSTTTSAAYAHSACLKIGATYYGRGQTAGNPVFDAGHTSGVASGSAIEDHVTTSTVSPATNSAYTYTEVNGILEFGVCGDDFTPDANFYQADITVNYHTPITSTPPTLDTAITFYVPTVTVTANILVTPPTLSNAITLFAPTVTAPFLATPDTLAAVATFYDPTVTAIGTFLGTPPTLDTTLTLYEPNILLPVLVIPDTLANTITLYVPTVEVSEGGSAESIPETLGLTVTLYEPTIETPVMVIPDTLELITTLYEPTVSFTNHITVVIPTLDILTAFFVPTVTALNPTLVTPLTLELAVSLFEPSVLLPVLVTIPTLVLGGGTPSGYGTLKYWTGSEWGAVLNLKQWGG